MNTCPDRHRERPGPGVGSAGPARKIAGLIAESCRVLQGSWARGGQLPSAPWRVVVFWSSFVVMAEGFRRNRG